MRIFQAGSWEYFQEAICADAGDCYDKGYLLHTAHELIHLGWSCMREKLATVMHPIEIVTSLQLLCATLGTLNCNRGVGGQGKTKESMPEQCSLHKQSSRWSDLDWPPAAYYIHRLEHSLQPVAGTHDCYPVWVLLHLALVVTVDVTLQGKSQ